MCSAFCQNVGWPGHLPAFCLSWLQWAGHSQIPAASSYTAGLLIHSSSHFHCSLLSQNRASCSQDACLHVDVSLHCGAPCHRHFVAQSNLCSFLLSFPSLLSAAWRLLKMWWEWWVYYMHRGMTLLCRIKALVAAEPFPWAAGCHLHPAFRPGICPMVLMWKKTM